MLPSRLTRIFFLVEVSLEKMSIADLSLQVWDPEKEPSLSCWLKQMGAEGLICGDASAQQKMALLADGIWVQSHQEGEVHEVVERWIRSSPERAEKRPGQNPPVVRNSHAPQAKMLDNGELVRHGRARSQRRPENQLPTQAMRPAVSRSKVGLGMEREYRLGA
jgi:predicted Fe-Mo cluster-binding NifX family protein